MEPYNTPDPMNQMPGTMEPRVEKRSSVGPLAGIIIIVILIAAGALYFWGAYLNNQGEQNPPPLLLGDESGGTMMEGQSGASMESDAEAGLPPQSSSDDVSSIEADLNAMSFDTLEAENEASASAVQ